MIEITIGLVDAALSEFAGFWMQKSAVGVGACREEFAYCRTR
jgi:hypothetical protein